MERMKSKFGSLSRDELSLTAGGANDDLAAGVMSLGMSGGNLQLMLAGVFCCPKLSETRFLYAGAVAETAVDVKTVLNHLCEMDPATFFVNVIGEPCGH